MEGFEVSCCWEQIVFRVQNTEHSTFNFQHRKNENGPASGSALTLNRNADMLSALGDAEGLKLVRDRRPHPVQGEGVSSGRVIRVIRVIRAIRGCSRSRT